MHEVAPGIIHLMRGQVYDFAGYKWFAMGGARSHDRIYRKENKSWWSAEMPSPLECAEAVANLEKNNWNVNFVITHCVPSSIIPQIAKWYECDAATDFLETIYQKLKYNAWFAGHYHVNKKIGDKHIILYDQIVEVIK